MLDRASERLRLLPSAECLREDIIRAGTERATDRVYGE